jgi:hypothetical protein
MRTRRHTWNLSSSPPLAHWFRGRFPRNKFGVRRGPRRSSVKRGAMSEPRASTARRQLAELEAVSDPPKWSWAIVTLEPSGRVRLPAVCLCGARRRTRRLRTRVGDLSPGLARGPCRRGWATVDDDGRGRLYVPAWLRRGHDASLLVGTRYTDRVVVLVTPAFFDRVGNALIGSLR